MQLGPGHIIRRQKKHAVKRGLDQYCFKHERVNLDDQKDKFLFLEYYEEVLGWILLQIVENTLC
jgi:hypothetical protein